jgi:ATP-dependent RNA helicase SUPV3L1/SUV3
MDEATAGQEGDAPAGAPPAAPLDVTNIRGFQVMPTASGASPEADAPPAAAALDEETRKRELAKEFSVRAARLAEAVDDALVLANDGTIRWLGDPIAKLVAGEETLKPRAVILADDALSTEGREAAHQRVALWLAAHIRKTLGPLLALCEPDSIPESVRDLAAKLSQSLGILERERVKSQVKALDQNARGALRKLGVRFGAHYLYVPALLKPTARALCAQLWALLRRDVDKEATAERLLHFAASGRTSFAVEAPASGEVYRIAGFRVCGDRAVRVDIVERLTDLIRAALPRHGQSEARAPGEENAAGFVVTNQMTSLTGCSGEHFASILRSLGFASHKVKKSAHLAASRAAQVVLAPASGVPSPAASDAPADRAAAPEESQEAVAPEASLVVPEPQAEREGAPEAQAGEDGAPEAQAGEDGAPEARLGAEEGAAEARLEAEEGAPEARLEAAVIETVAPSEAPGVAEPADLRESEAGDAPSAESEASALPAGEAEAPGLAALEPAAVSEEELIEVWRTAPRHSRHAGRDHGRPPRRSHAPAPAEGEAAPAAEPRTPWRERRHGGAPRPSEPEGARAAETNGHAAAAPRPAGEPAGEPREGRRPRWRRDGAKGPRPEENRAAAPVGEGKGRPRPQPPEPRVNLDSPFAKLLDLKPLLKSRDGKP